MLSERRQLLKTTCCMSLFIWNVHTGKLQRQSRLVVAVGYKDCEEQGMTTNGVSFWGDENVGKLEYGDSCQLQLI